MARLIDADALWCDIMMLPHNGDIVSSEEVEQAIKNTPTVDAVPVVRCGKCLCFKETMGKDSGKPCGYGECKHPLGIRGIVGTESYCSYGERKDNG